MNLRLKTAAAFSAAVLALWAGAFNAAAVEDESAGVENTEIVVNDSVENPEAVVNDSVENPEAVVNDSVENPEAVVNDSVDNSETVVSDSVDNSETVVNDSEENAEIIVNDSEENPVLEAGSAVAINAANFPDAAFRQYVSNYCDTNNDGSLSQEERDCTTWMSVGNKSISSLKGIEYFTDLQELYCHCNNLTSLDVSKNTALEHLDCQSNQLTVLDVSKNIALEFLSCYGNHLTSLDVSNNTALTDLRADFYHNTYSIGDVVCSYPLRRLPAGFDITKASNWQGAEYDSSTNSIKNFTEMMIRPYYITYTYDCGNGYTAEFALLADSYTTEIATVSPPSFAVKGVFGGRKVTFDCDTPGATIYYTTEGRSTLKLTDPHVNPGDTVLFTAYYGTVYARAYYNGKWSNPARLILKIPKVNTPTITKLSNGKYKIKTTTPGTIVYYTIDGTTPSATNYKGKFWTSHDVSIPAGKTVKAIAVRTCFSDSEVATAKT